MTTTVLVAGATGMLGGRIAMKLSSPLVQHKSELGGVALGLDRADEVRGAYRRLAALAQAHGGSVLIERMASPGTTWPTVPILLLLGRFTVAAAVVSVSP